MFADHTLTPKEATRLATLGMLALEPLPYSDLAIAVRHFIDRVIGPSPEIMGHSIELLRFEGLVEALTGAGDQTVLRLTEKGRNEMRILLTARLRAADTALNKLVVALKFRFLHLLATDEQCEQAELLVEICEQELARLEDLRRHHGSSEGFLAVWLDHDIGLLDAKLAWLVRFRDELCGSGTLPEPDHRAAGTA